MIHYSELTRRGRIVVNALVIGGMVVIMSIIGAIQTGGMHV
jgi:hypothetical protein